MRTRHLPPHVSWSHVVYPACLFPVARHARPFNAFSWQLWLLLFSSAFVVGGVLWLYNLLDKAARAAGSEEDEEPDALEAEACKSSLESNYGRAAGLKDGGGGREKPVQLSDSSNARPRDTDLEAGSKSAGDGKGGLGSHSASGESAVLDKAQSDGKGGDMAAGKPERSQRSFLRMLSVKEEEEKETLDDLSEYRRALLALAGQEPH